MERLARKIAPAKWEKKAYLREDSIAADAISSCLRSRDNALSFWVCDEAESSLQEVVLACASSSHYDRPEKMHLVVLDTKALLDSRLQIARTDGDTLVNSLRQTHRDIVHLSIEDLCTIAHLIAPRVRADRDCHVFSKAEVLGILRTAVRAGRLSLDLLSEKVRAAIEKGEQT